MRAAWYDRPGAARDVLDVGDMAAPTPHHGEVLIQVKASGINPSDYKHRGTGGHSGMTARMVPHSDGAGIVAAVGTGVDSSWIGLPVWMWNAIHRGGYGSPAPREQGTAAELVVMPVDFVSPLPTGTSFATGACLGVPAFTAFTAVLADGSVAGRTVLVQGGAGAVGELAVQLAVDAGARVIATVSSAHKAERAREAGAHDVINYREDDVRSAVKRISPDGVDRIVEVDFAANIQTDADIIAPYGTIASYSSTSEPEPRVPYYNLQFKGVTLRTIQVFTMPTDLRLTAVDAINSALERVALRPTVAQSFSLDQVAAAHEAAEAGPDGNVLLEM
jgi:NADPH2:quinone reductase